MKSIFPILICIRKVVNMSFQIKTRPLCTFENKCTYIKVTLYETPISDRFFSLEF